MRASAARASFGTFRTTSSNRSSTWPALLMRVLVVVTISGCSCRWLTFTPAARSCRRSSFPASSQPTTPAMRTRAPSAARFMAVLAAPPGAKARLVMSTTGAGASRQSLSMEPFHQPSSMTSPTTVTDGATAASRPGSQSARPRWSASRAWSADGAWSGAGAWSAGSAGLTPRHPLCRRQLCRLQLCRLRLCHPPEERRYGRP